MSNVKACSIEDCPNPVLARGWCEMHYQRNRRGGDMTAPIARRGSRPATREGQIGGRMQDARKRLGVSQEAIAHRLDISTQTYGRWERGRSLGFIGRIGEIAAVLETSESDLWGRSAADVEGAVVELAHRLASLCRQHNALIERVVDLERQREKEHGA